MHIANPMFNAHVYETSLSLIKVPHLLMLMLILRSGELGRNDVVM